MPRGRHRHSSPLHGKGAPAAVVAVALVCVVCSMFFGAPGLSDVNTVLLRVCTNVAALAAVFGAIWMRRWDRYAGRRVSELKMRQSSLEWRAEERQAELEGELDEVREERDGLQALLGDKRSELARLRSEYAGLLRRFAHSETELASVVEGARKLQLESGAPVKALASGTTDHRQQSGAPSPLTYLQANEALKNFAGNSARQFQREREERERVERGERAEHERQEALRRREEQQERERRKWREGQEQAAAAAPGVPEQPREQNREQSPEQPREQSPEQPREQHRGEPGTGRFDFFGGGGNKRRRRAAQQRQPTESGHTARDKRDDGESAEGAGGAGKDAEADTDSSVRNAK